MKNNIEFRTDRGVATYCGDLVQYSVLIHTSPKPEGKWPIAYQGVLDVILSVRGEPENFLGTIPLNEVVCSRGLEFEGGVELSANDCINIDEMCWQVLSSKYGVVPNEFIVPESK